MYAISLNLFKEPGFGIADYLYYMLVSQLFSFLSFLSSVFSGLFCYFSNFLGWVLSSLTVDLALLEDS